MNEYFIIRDGVVRGHFTNEEDANKALKEFVAKFGGVFILTKYVKSLGA